MFPSFYLNTHTPKFTRPSLLSLPPLSFIGNRDLLTHARRWRYGHAPLSLSPSGYLWAALFTQHPPWCFKYTPWKVVDWGSAKLPFSLRLWRFILLLIIYYIKNNHLFILILYIILTNLLNILKILYFNGCFFFLYL